MRAVVAVLVLAVGLAGCGGSAPPTTTGVDARLEERADAYASSAWRAVEDTAFATVGVEGLSQLVVESCEGLGVGGIGVAAADTGVVAPDDEVDIFLEVLRTGLEQVCQERALVDLTSVYTRAVREAVRDAGAEAAYDEIAVIRAGPAACRALDAGEGAETALLVVVESLYGVRAGSVTGLEGGIDADQANVAGAVFGAAASVVCPEHIGAVQALVGEL